MIELTFLIRSFRHRTCKRKIFFLAYTLDVNVALVALHFCCENKKTRKERKPTNKVSVDVIIKQSAIKVARLRRKS